MTVIYKSLLSVCCTRTLCGTPPSEMLGPLTTACWGIISGWEGKHLATSAGVPWGFPPLCGNASYNESLFWNPLLDINVHEWNHEGDCVFGTPSLHEEGYVFIVPKFPLARQANKSADNLLEQGITTLMGKLADWEDGKLTSQNNHLVGGWMPRSFMDQRWGGGEEVK